MTTNLMSFWLDPPLPFLRFHNIFQNSLKYFIREVEMRAAQIKPQPLDFLKLLAHDIRWRVLLALAQSDHRVEELVKKIQQPHNLISYHLKRLRLQQLVTERRSSADGRDIYYSLNLDQFRQLYLQTGQSLHPAIGGASPQPYPQAKPIAYPKVHVLFLCTHNSARSQMAESLLRKLGGDQVEVFSAGSEPTSIHPLAIKVMSEVSVDLSQHRSKHLSEFVGQSFDYVVTVCDRIREVCPVFPGDPEQIHWSFPDPAAIEGNLQKQERAFANTANQLMLRIQYLLLMIQRNREEKK
jgi:ArsR family transcriptional regulator, arsenate/arsenite/antimonite-responsive transcriptional repressor / arsenate reductase (thioredoxin)